MNGNPSDDTERPRTWADAAPFIPKQQSYPKQQPQVPRPAQQALHLPLVSMHATYGPPASRAQSSPATSSLKLQFSCAQTISLAEGVAQPTTMYICGIPNCLSLVGLVELINIHGFGNTYDLVYIPTSIPNGRHNLEEGLKSACVNFKYPAHAVAFERDFCKSDTPGCEWMNIMCVKPYHCQGHKANMEMHFQTFPGDFLTFP